MNYFPEPAPSKNEIKIDLDLFYYATKSEIKSATGVNTSKFC